LSPASPHCSRAALSHPLNTAFVSCCSACAGLGAPDFHTFFSPSAALLPLEYCLNLTDQEMIGDEDGVADLQKWRTYIKSESGVELDIVA